ncbi:MAG: zinc-binding dehydrogenase, partial [Candidatus Omnitrophica bacterium]|nr:zinc-binding dehydrogenase [Candidatus Omnitrophota bacterium]
CSSLFASDLFSWRLQMAQAIGATDTVLASQQSLVDQVAKKIQDGVDVVFEAAGKEETFQQCLALARISGELVFIGIPDQETISLNPHLLRRKELTVTNVRRSAHTTEIALNLLAKKPGVFSRLVTHSFSLEETESALRLVANYQDKVIKAVVEL